MEINTTATTSNTTEPTMPTIPLLGWPGPRFYTIHIVALVSLATSVVASAAVLVIMNGAMKRFWRRPIGERLVVYLAVCDLLFSISHILDHSYIVHAKAHPPDAICAANGFVTASFVLVQAFIVCFTAVNGFVLVVRERKVSLGQYDWRLLVTTLTLPLTIMVPALAMGWLGPGPAWCVTDMRKLGGVVLINVMSLINLLTIVACCVSYVFIYVKIRQVAARMAEYSSPPGRRHRTARVMMLFVAAYVGQWCTHVVLSIWYLVDHTLVPDAVLNVAVFTTNMGGVFNLIAYTIMRRYFTSSRPLNSTNEKRSMSRTLSTSSSKSRV